MIMNDNLKLIKKIIEGMESTGFKYGSLYELDKQSITKLYETLGKEKKENIYTLLVVIDSTYSTQMTKRYYAMDELSDVLWGIEQRKPLEQAFCDLLKDKDFTPFNIPGKGTNLFTENYGIGKDGKDKGKAVSFISKFAYFVTGCKFPIYDSIVKEMFPLFWKFCGFPKNEMPKIEKNDIVSLINAIDMFIERLGEHGIPADYDIIDQLLWRTGKIRRGNWSLILSMEQYQKYAQNTEKPELAFHDDPLMLEYYELAKRIEALPK